jgi:hypothetical protein
MYFIFIVIVFMFAFGVSTQALMYHNQTLDIELLKNVFFPAYFVIGGEYYTRDLVMSAGECVQNGTLDPFEMTRYTQDDCPEKTGAKVTLALYVLYLIILNILLVNLLIAIFRYYRLESYFKLSLKITFILVIHLMKYKMKQIKYGSFKDTLLSMNTFINQYYLHHLA